MPNSDFRIGDVAQTVGAQLDAEKQAPGDMMDNFDADDPAAAFKIEMEVSRYKTEMGLMAALVKDISDIQQQIIQKI